MGKSSLLGVERAPQAPKGTDTAALGPSDNSDSGSDVAGIAQGDGSDIGLPVDVAMRDDEPHPLMPKGAMSGSASDAEGTGERRSAASDAGLREAPDIGTDHVFAPGRTHPSASTEREINGVIDAAEADDPLDDEKPARRSTP